MTLALLSILPVLALIILSNVDWEVSDLLWGVAICIGAVGLFREMDEDPSKGGEKIFKNQSKQSFMLKVKEYFFNTIERLF